MVTPWLAQDDGDISKMAETRPLRVGPIGPTAAGLFQGDPAAVIMLVGQMHDKIFQTVAIFNTPGPGQGHHKEVPTPLNQLEVCCGRKGGISNDHDHLRPCRPPKADQHPAEQPILGPIAEIVLAADHLEVDRNPVIPPVEHHDHNMESKDVGGIFVQPPFLGQWMLLACFLFERAIDDQIAHTIRRRRQRRNDLVGKPPQQDPPIPIGRGQQTAKMPLRDMPWGQPCQPCECRLVLIDRLADEQPAEDQMMAMAKHGLQHVQPVGYLLGQTGQPDHRGSP
jgi:hypothetical protein